MWIQRESLVEELACARGFARELVEVRPGRLGVYVVRCEGGNAAPVVNASVDKLRKYAGAQIRRCLNRHLWPEDQTRNSETPDEFFEIRLRCFGHLGVGLGAKILHDDLLQMPVALMGVTQCE